MPSTVPIWIDDPINAAILAVSEDRLQGFQLDPFGEVAERSGLDVATVLERIVAMLRAGTIRRVRQTLMATNLAAGSLCAWQVSPENLNDAFDWLSQVDPFSGHVVIRTTDSATTGSNYRLWTTLKVPQGYDIAKYAAFLAGRIGAEAYRLMPAQALFALGVGHVRRRGMEPGARADVLAEVKDTEIVSLDAREWQVLTAIKREFAPEEIVRDVWRERAAETGLSLEEFARIGGELNAKKVIGRFSTFLEHVKPNAAAGGASVTRYNALFHWKVPVGREIDAGREVGRHYIMTHAYWREGGPEFRGVNVMGVAHGTEKETVLAHKAAIDQHLREAGIEFDYTNVFWGGRSEIKPSEIAPDAFRDFCRAQGIDAEAMR
ncbi:MAG: Lrp/AsnC family transcriptional regulator [Vulcanimicrobiaceae bacterium]|jgi:DNA-binding Lrp family transcriptional regulator